MSVAKKKKHVSKKNKKAWRKYCDITDVEAFLEDQRLEERLGKFDTKPDSELFILDTEGDNKPVVFEEKPLSAKLRKRSKLAETPKCFEILLPSSKVQDPNAKRNHVNPVGAKPTALSKVTEKRRFEKGAYQKKIELARKNRWLAVEKNRKVKQSRQNFHIDLWGEQAPETKGIPETLCDEFVSPEAQLHNVLTERRLRPKPPPPKTVTTRAAIETPHPGVSYNPSFKEHQELLQEVVQHEHKMMKREAHLMRVTNGMFRKVTQAQKENQWREEMSVGLPQPHNPCKDPSDSVSDTDNVYKAINPPVKNKKKNLKTRRKQREQLEEKERLKREKINKKKITDIYKLRKIQSSILNSEQKKEEVHSKRKQKKTVEKATAVPALNAHKTPKKEPDFVEPEQLTGDLRHVSAKTNLLRDRYESLQRRGALAAAKLMMKKKKNLKSYFKPGHKVTEQDIERYIAKARTAGKK
ncbi:ribosome biogenesis protein NOP53 [Hyposmocoma kahamanoa]|uniref:ribosome biogenesis protein NOP53 n=1 Tax=Hyposmocoma kahamanoa TaxID=1477025 RepID=UPI000E6D640A|nr:ribosome biogenesis protein NOP53 [Hyposmocoma kahamanoa]